MHFRPGSKCNCVLAADHCAGFIDREFDQLADQAVRIDERIVPIDLQKLATTALSLLDNSEYEFVQVGSSGRDITKYLPCTARVITQDVTVTTQSRVRDQRGLVAAELPKTTDRRCFVDDVAVSGCTLAAAARAGQASQADQALVGMAWDSRRLRSRVPLALTAAVTYKQAGGGMPAVNSLATFSRYPELASEYAVRKFDDIDALTTILTTYERTQQ